MKRVTIEDAPAVLNMNDRAMWVLGYNELVEKLEGHAIALGRTGPLGRAISVLQDVLTDIEDWEDKALAEAVTDARKGLLMMLEVEKLKRAANPVPRVIASGVKEDAAPTVLRPCQDDGYRHLWEDEQGRRFILAHGVMEDAS